MRLADEWKADEKFAFRPKTRKRKKRLAGICANQDLAHKLNNKDGRNTES